MKAFPDKKQIRAWLQEHPDQASRRDLVRAFGLKGDQRAELRDLLRKMEQDGALDREGKIYRVATAEDTVRVLDVLGPDADGDVFAEPAGRIAGAIDGAILVKAARGVAPPGEGDRILARLTRVEGRDHAWEAHPIRHLPKEARVILGIYRAGEEGGRIIHVDKGENREWQVSASAALDARDGELVEARALHGRPSGLPRARILARIGDPLAPRATSLIAIHQHGIPDRFPDGVLAEARALPEFSAGKGRRDLRDLLLVTIDPADARDRDDAVGAVADDAADNPGGFVIQVAIADVAHYVRPGTLIDHEARERGNSTYFPDRVVPMLPERISTDLCSLNPGEDRPCLGVSMRIDARGEKLSHRFFRGVMRSRAALSYEEVQRAADGHPDERIAPLVAPVIRPLYGAYEALCRARDRRAPLDLDLPERDIVLGDDGRVASVAFRERLDSHRLIEEFMVLANVAAAEELEKRRVPFLYRVHEEPGPEKLDALREVAEASGFVLAKGQVLKTRHLNDLLHQSEGTDADELINMSTLRAMAQAYYNPDNFGHFGLALPKYAHFTSPIRRYSDLITHRALIRAHGWGGDGLSDADIADLAETARRISATERRSMMAERDTTDRYLAAWLAERTGAEFDGRIAGVQRFGIFVRLDESGADGLVPIRNIGREFFLYDARRQMLTGSDSGIEIMPGQRVSVRLVETAPVSGGLVLELLTLDDKPLPSGRRAPRRKGAKGRARRVRKGVKRAARAKKEPGRAPATAGATAGGGVGRGPRGRKTRRSRPK